MSTDTPTSGLGRIGHSFKGAATDTFKSPLGVIALASTIGLGVFGLGFQAFPLVAFSAMAFTASFLPPIMGCNSHRRAANSLVAFLVAVQFAVQATTDPLAIIGVILGLNAVARQSTLTAVPEDQTKKRVGAAFTFATLSAAAIYFSTGQTSEGLERVGAASSLILATSAGAAADIFPDTKSHRARVAAMFGQACTLPLSLIFAPNYFVAAMTLKNMAHGLFQIMTTDVPEAKKQNSNYWDYLKHGDMPTKPKPA